MSFLITGVCGELDSNGYEVFNHIANIYGGKVYDYHSPLKTKIEQILIDTKEKLDQHYAGLITSDASADFTRSKYDIEIDGKIYVVQFIDPANQAVDNAIETKLQNGKNYTIIQPDLGLWQIRIGNETYSFHVTEIEHMIFSHGYSINELNSMSNAKFVPSTGKYFGFTYKNETSI